MSIGKLKYGERAAREVSERFGGAVATQTALAALPLNALANQQLFFCEDTQSLWEYSSTSSAAASDDALTPTGSGVAGMFLRASGSVRAAIPIALTDATVTIQPTAGLHRVMPPATLTTGRSVTLGTTGAVLGMRWRITRQDVTANTLTIINGGGGAGNITVMPVSTKGFVVAYFDGTNWLFESGATSVA
jgi:hypothetical protein